jgi:hypothetical protein
MVEFNYSAKIANKTIFPLAVCFLLFFSCGIEDYPYIYPVPAGNIRSSLDNWVEIQIPPDNSNFFTHFIIYYRIYISDSPSATNFPSINSALVYDYNQISPYIGNANIGGSAIPNVFRNRNYFLLTLEGTNIDTLLSESNAIRNRKLIINFGYGKNPYLALDADAGTGFLLHRNGSSFELMPTNGYFKNSGEIRNLNNITASNINNDVADNPNASSREYTYVAMFIVATGLDPQTFAQLFSTPAFIGVFKLPD